MILIDDILISDDIVKKKFACDLSACKGACCIEGDFGAPLSEDELLTIKKILPKVLPYLDKEAKEFIEAQGFSVYNDEAETHETNLLSDGACVFMGRNELGITFCSIEKAFYDNKIDFKKPISCHLYPVRVNQNKEAGFQALNYDKWDICSAACKRGKKEKIRVYEFVKEALIRKYGETFYDRLSQIADRR